MKKKYKPYRVNFRAVVDKATFDETQEILKILNLTIGEVIGMLCNQIVLHRKLPFEIKATSLNKLSEESDGDNEKC